LRHVAINQVQSMIPKKIITLSCVVSALLLGGCAVVSVATTAVAVTGAVVSTGVTVGSVAVGAAAGVTKGAVGLVTDSDDDDD
jgi:hypothetical protein